MNKIIFPCGKETEYRIFGGRSNPTYSFTAAGETCDHIPIRGFGGTKKEAEKWLKESMQHHCDRCTFDKTGT